VENGKERAATSVQSWRRDKVAGRPLGCRFKDARGIVPSVFSSRGWPQVRV